ncbi:MAG: helix-turn-helix transcriptional regulator [Phycisphaerae bacterium]|jgi:transcriptional regulator with XRE-family HTH domain
MKGPLPIHEARKVGFGKIVRTRRLARNLRQWQVAELVHVTTPMVSDWEGGVHLPKKSNLRRLVKAVAQNDEEAKELISAWQNAHGGADDAAVEAATEKLAAAIEQAKAGSRRGPHKSEYHLVRREDWALILREQRRLKRLTADRNEPDPPNPPADT